MEPTKNSNVDFKLEVVVIPVSDVDRAKTFYGGLGWRLDADYASDDGYFRVIQFTPPGSGCSVIFGKDVTGAAPGSAQGLYLIVSDIKAARDELISHGVEIGEVFLSCPRFLWTAICQRGDRGDEGHETRNRRQLMLLLRLWSARAGGARPRCP